MVKFLKDSFIRRSISCLLILSILLTCFNFPLPARADVGEDSQISLFSTSYETVLLSTVSAGSEVGFAGYQWIVMNPAEGLLLMKNAFGSSRLFDNNTAGANEVFDPTSTTNIGYDLIDSFLTLMSLDDQNLIESHSWNVGNSVYNSQVVSSKVGLLDTNQVSAYHEILLANPLNGWWTSNWYNVGAGNEWTAGQSGNYYIDNTGVPVVETDYNMPHLVRPAVYLSATATVQIAVQNVSLSDILSFSVADELQSADIDTANHQIFFYVPKSANIEAISPTITVAGSASITPSSGVPQDFTKLVEYVVSSAEGTQIWTANCVRRSTRAEIENFNVAEMGSNNAVINTNNYTIEFTVPFGTLIDNLVPTFFGTEGATVEPSSGTGRDFTSPVTYKVTAEAGNIQTWTVTCKVEDNQTDTYDLQFVENGGSTVPDINGIQFEEVVSPPPEPTRDNYTFVGWYKDEALTELYDFSAPVTQSHTLYAKYLQSGKNILDFQVSGQVGATSIDTNEQRIIFHMPYGSNVTELSPSITVSPGATVSPTSGSKVDFRSMVTYTVTAENGSMRIWAVRCVQNTANNPTPTQEIVVEKKPETEQEVLEEAIKETKKELVEVRTGSATVTGPNSATLTGTLVAGGGTQIQTGFKYREADAGQWLYTSAQGGNMTNGQSFSVEIEDLKANTSYEFEARASNASGLSNGGNSSFMTEKAKEPTVITNTATTGTGVIGNMLLAGSVTKDGGDSILDAGFLWGDSPTTLKKLSLGAVKNLSSVLYDLEIGKTYYYQAYAANSSGTGLGKLLEYIVPGLTVKTLGAIDITENSATLQATVTGKDKIIECGFTISPGKQGVVIAKLDEKGNYQVQVKDLDPKKVYYYTAYAKTENKTYLGKSRKLTPLNFLPRVETYEVKEVGQIWAQFSGYIHDNNSDEESGESSNQSKLNVIRTSSIEEYPISECGFYWGESAEDTGMQIIIEGEGKINDLRHRLAGLKAGTTYYYKAYAVNKKGTGYGDTLSFTTAAPTKPVVTTRFAGYDNKRGQWIMTGAVSDNGGVPLTEYGFLISSDNTVWTELPIGFDILGIFVAKNLPFLSQLKPGTYFAKAYAVNEVGREEGTSISFEVPILPTVEAGIDPESPAPGTNLLKGSITETGGDGVLCNSTRFKYRKKGDANWITIGETNGEFGISDFSYQLAGLIPGVSYEFQAEAGNITGISTSQTLVFTADYGKDVKLAVEYLSKNGAKLPEIANVLKDEFAYSLEATAQILLQYGYTNEEIGKALKDSNYKATYKDAAQVFQKLGFSAITTAKLLYDYYDDMRRTGYNLDWEMVKVLKANQYELKDIADAATKVFGYDISRLLVLLMTGSMYSKKEARGAAFKVFGQTAMIDYLWADTQNSLSKGRTPIAQLLREFIIDLRDICGMDSIAIADKLMENYPQLNLELAASLYADAGYPVDNTVEALNHLFGASDIDLGNALYKTRYNPEDIINYLIKGAQYSALQMVKVITYAVKWKDPKEGCTLVLKNNYGMNAVEAAKVMYAAGWTEAVADGTGYGLGQLLTAMEMYYGKKSDYDKIGILKELGQSPLAISLRIAGKAGWVKDYRAQGYSAADTALWYREAPGEKRSGLKTQIKRAVQFCDEGGYEPIDIALALRTVFNLDMATSLSNMTSYTKKTTKQINEALKIAYGEDPLVTALAAMTDKPIKQVTSSLYNTYNISSPSEATRYLLEAGFSYKTILEGMWPVYFNKSTAAGFTEFLNYAKQSLPKSSFVDALNVLIYYYGNTPDPYSIISMLQLLDYDMKSIADILYKEYHLPLKDALNGMLDRYGRAKEALYTPVTLTTYGVNMASYIEYEKMQGTSAAKCTDLLINVFKVKDAAEVAGILAKGGYGKLEVSGILLEVFFKNTLTSDTAEQINNILMLNYPISDGDNIKKLLENGQVKPVSRAIGVLTKAGYGLESVIKALKEFYSLSDAQIIDELNTLDQFDSDEISIAAQGALGNNYLAVLISQWKKEPWGNAEGVWGHLKNELGITDSSSIFRYLRYSGFTESETVGTAYSFIYERIVPVIKSVYDVKDAVSMGKLLAPFRKEGILGMGTDQFADQLKAAFPGTTTYDIALAFRAYGYPINTGTDNIENWLRSYACDGKHDDKLAAYLGKNNDGLGIPVRYAAEVLEGKGYVVEDAVYWLLQCGYTWEEFYGELVHQYGPISYSTIMYENNSSSKFIVGYLKDYYDIKDIARGEVAYTGNSSMALADLVSGGYTLEQSVYAILWMGKTGASDMVIGIVDNSINRANAARNQGLRLNAVAATSMVFDVSIAVAYDKQKAGIENTNLISMADIAAGLVKYGPSRDGGYFSDWEVLAAMQAVAEKYNALTGSGLPTRELALATLRLGGASASDAAAMLAAHKVGLSTTSIIKSIFGIGNDWIAAVKSLAGAGYSFSSSISAVYNNSSYHTVIGLGILSTITSSAVGTLSSNANIKTYINLVKEGAKLGFKIGEGTITWDDVLKYDPNYLQYKYGKMIYNYIPK